MKGSLRNYLSGLAAAWRSASPLRQSAFLTVFCLAIFVLVNWRNYVRDFIPLTLEPVVVVREGTIRLDSYRAYTESENAADRFAFVESGGHLYPMKPMFVSLLAVPFYLPPLLAGVPTDAVEFWIGWGRLTAAVLAGLAVALCAQAARRWASDGTALGLSLLLAFGTSVWTVWGQSLNYHLGAGLCVAAIVFLLKDFPLSPARAAAAGFLVGAAFGMRPTAAVLLAPLGLYLLLPGRLGGPKALLAAALGLAVVPACNLALNRWAFGGWFATGYSAAEIDRWTTPAWEGAAGLLLAPNSGLWVQSPFMLLSLAGGWAAWRGRGPLPRRGLLRAYSLCFVAYWLLFARWHDWQGGLTFSSRMLSEGYPLWLPLVAAGWGRVRSSRPARWLVYFAAAWSVAYQLAGVALFDAVSVDNPVHDPWHVGRHFYMLYVEQHGVAQALAAVGLTAGLFLGCAAAAAYVCGRVFLATGQRQSVPPALASSINGNSEVNDVITG